MPPERKLYKFGDFIGSYETVVHGGIKWHYFPNQTKWYFIMDDSVCDTEELRRITRRFSKRYKYRSSSKIFVGVKKPSINIRAWPDGKRIARQTKPGECFIAERHRSDKWTEIIDRTGKKGFIQTQSLICYQMQRCKR